MLRACAWPVNQNHFHCICFWLLGITKEAPLNSGISDFSPLYRGGLYSYLAIICPDPPNCHEPSAPFGFTTLRRWVVPGRAGPQMLYSQITLCTSRSLEERCHLELLECSKSNPLCFCCNCLVFILSCFLTLPPPFFQWQKSKRNWGGGRNQKPTLCKIQTFSTSFHNVLLRNYRLFLVEPYRRKTQTFKNVLVNPPTLHFLASSSAL